MLIDNTISLNAAALAQRKSSNCRRGSIREVNAINISINEYLSNQKKAHKILLEIISEFKQGIPEDKVYEKIYEFYSKKSDLVRYIDRCKTSVAKINDMCKGTNRKPPKIPKDKRTDRLDELYKEANALVLNARNKMRERAHGIGYYSMSAEKITNGISSLLARWDDIDDRGLPLDRLVVAQRMSQSIAFYESEAAFLKTVFATLGFFEKLKVPSPEKLMSKVVAADKEISAARCELELECSISNPIPKRLSVDGLMDLQ